jgi:hypothetical protein
MRNSLWIFKLTTTKFHPDLFALSFSQKRRPNREVELGLPFLWRVDAVNKPSSRYPSNPFLSLGNRIALTPHLPFRNESQNRVYLSAWPDAFWRVSIMKQFPDSIRPKLNARDKPCRCPKKFTADSRLAPLPIPISQACWRWSKSLMRP